MSYDGTEAILQSLHATSEFYRHNERVDATPSRSDLIQFYTTAELDEMFWWEPEPADIQEE